MTSKEVYQFLETGSVKALYDKYTNVFAMIDKWEDAQGKQEHSLRI
jgi:hypothetical protein